MIHSPTPCFVLMYINKAFKRLVPAGRLAVSNLTAFSVGRDRAGCH